MMRLSSLNVGDRFRVAYSSEMSMNCREMSQEMVFQITKVYEQEPMVRICVDCGGSGGIYSLMPGVLAIYPSEPRPSPREIEKFLGLGRKTVPVAYEILWDGTTDISDYAPLSCLNLLRVWITFGEPIMSRDSLFTVIDENYYLLIKKLITGGVAPSQILKKYLPRLVSIGLVVETTDKKSFEARTREIYRRG